MPTRFVAHQAATKTFEADLRQTSFTGAFRESMSESLGKSAIEAPDSLAIVLTNSRLGNWSLCAGDEPYIQRDKKGAGKVQWKVRTANRRKMCSSVSFFQNGCTNFAGLFDTTVARPGPRHRNGHALPKASWSDVPPALRGMSSVGHRLTCARCAIGLIWDSYITYEFRNPRRNQPLASHCL